MRGGGGRDSGLVYDFAISSGKMHVFEEMCCFVCTARPEFSVLKDPLYMQAWTIVWKCAYTKITILCLTNEYLCLHLIVVSMFPVEDCLDF